MINPDVATLKGQINASFTRGLTVQLYDMSRHETLSTSEIKGDGEFEFRDAPPGAYLVTVTNERGEAVYQSNVSIGGPGMTPLHDSLVRRTTRSRCVAADSGNAISLVSCSIPHRAKRSTQRHRRRDSPRQATTRKRPPRWKSRLRSRPTMPMRIPIWARMYLRLVRYRDSIAETERSIAIEGATAPKLDVGLVLFLNHGPMDEVRTALSSPPGPSRGPRRIGKIAARKLVPR